MFVFSLITSIKNIKIYPPINPIKAPNILLEFETLYLVIENDFLSSIKSFLTPSSMQINTGMIIIMEIKIPEMTLLLKVLKNKSSIKLNPKYIKNAEEKKLIKKNNFPLTPFK